MRTATVSKRKEEVKALRERSKYRTALQAQLPEIDAALSNPDTDYIEARIPEKYVKHFISLIGKEDLAVYRVAQLSADTFSIKKRVIQV